MLNQEETGVRRVVVADIKRLRCACGDDVCRHCGNRTTHSHRIILEAWQKRCTACGCPTALPLNK